MVRARRRLRAVPDEAINAELAPDEPTGEAWLRALAAGDEAARLPEPLRALIAAAGREGRLEAEIGALRLVIERLLAEVGDADRLATLLPRLTNAIVRAQQAQRALGGEADDELAELIRRAMAQAATE